MMICYATVTCFFDVTFVMLMFLFLLCIPPAGGEGETLIYFVKYFRRMVLDVICFQASLSWKNAERRFSNILQEDACPRVKVLALRSLSRGCPCANFFRMSIIILLPETCSRILLALCVAAVLPLVRWSVAPV
jgi:hypothetical protein